MPTETDEIKEQQQIIDDYGKVFGTKAGERVLIDFMEMGRVVDSVFTGNSKTYYLSGKQDFANEILRIVAMSAPQSYMAVMKYRVNSLQEQTLARFSV